MPFARTFVIGLAVVSLLIPGGLVMTLCRCDMGGGQALQAARAASCCSAPQPTSRPQTPSAQRPPCGGCHFIVVRTPERETLALAQSARELAPLACSTAAPIAFASITTDRERLVLGLRELAPPGPPRSLPLRI
jgi:hypothetical protein